MSTSLVLGAVSGSVLNMIVCATLCQSQLVWAVENVLLIHYFYFNTINSLAVLVPAPYCNYNGYGQVIAGLGAMMAVTMVTYRCTTLSRHPLWIWVSPIWLFVALAAVMAHSEEYDAFVVGGDRCVKSPADTQPVWIMLTSFKVFLSVLTLILGSVGIQSSLFARDSDQSKRKHAFLRLVIVILADAVFCSSYSIASIVFDLQGSTKGAQVVSILHILNAVHRTFIPVLFLALHAG
ncbi:hypothetical protein HDU91_005228, partial [Kappamyces sp. JEL0680]